MLRVSAREREPEWRKKGGTFEVGIWVPAAAGNRQCGRTEATEKTDKPTFHRQDEEF